MDVFYCWGEHKWAHTHVGNVSCVCLSVHMFIRLTINTQLNVFLHHGKNDSVRKCQSTTVTQWVGDTNHECWHTSSISSMAVAICSLHHNKDIKIAFICWCHLYPLQHEQCVACVYRPCVTSLLGWWPDSIVCVTCLLDCFSWWESNAHKCSMFCMCIILTLSCPTMHWHCIPLVLCSELVVL